jgi:hypothetical protein
MIHDFHGEKRRLQEAFALLLLLLLLGTLQTLIKNWCRGVAGESLIKMQHILTTSIENCTKFCKSSFLAV